MSKKYRAGKPSAWIIIGVIILIVLLFGWQTCATEAGDTDVSSSTNFTTDNPQSPANMPGGDVQTVVVD